MIGGPTLPVNDEDEEIYFLAHRINKIQNLLNCTNLKKLCLRQNLIPKIEGLENDILNNLNVDGPAVVSNDVK